MPKHNKPIDVFKFIDTQEGNKDVCWQWTGAISGRDQRPTFRLYGKNVVPSRVVYELVKHPIPPKLIIRHTCDNGLCCNPYHLELGTRSQNENDKYERDRAGLPVLVVRDIKRMLAVTDRTQEAIAAAVSIKYNLNVSREAVRNIKLGLRRTQENTQSQDDIIDSLTSSINCDNINESVNKETSNDNPD